LLLAHSPVDQLVDETSLGRARRVISQFFRILSKHSASGVTILLVERNVRLALEAGDHAYVLENGRVRLRSLAFVLLPQRKCRQILSPAVSGVSHALNTSRPRSAERYRRRV
jgi:ABC-type branched-subunit amino acid transport system ATPase component